MARRLVPVFKGDLRDYQPRVAQLLHRDLPRSMRRRVLSSRIGLIKPQQTAARRETYVAALRSTAGTRSPGTYPQKALATAEVDKCA